MKMTQFYGLIAFIACLVCAFGLFQIINTNKPKLGPEVQTVVTDLRQLNPTNREDQNKINVPNDLKATQNIPKEPEVKVENAPKQSDLVPSKDFERGGFESQKDAYRI